MIQPPIKKTRDRVKPSTITPVKRVILASVFYGRNS
jgi:hypothetical protein